MIAVALSLASLLLLSAILPTFAYASSGGEEKEVGWKTSYAVGKFSHSNPPMPDQLFKVYYRVINGTIDNLSTPPLQVVANVSSANSSGGGLLEVKYPRNYPYTNNPGAGGGAGNFVFFAQPLGGRDIQVEGSGTTTDCFFVLSVPFSGKVRITIVSAVIPEENFSFHGDSVPASCIPDTVVTNKSEITPLQQFKAGVPAKDVACGNGLDLIVQPVSGKPYCATHSTVVKLSQWWNV
jgi:hypothetical protein